MPEKFFYTFWILIFPFLAVWFGIAMSKNKLHKLAFIPVVLSITGMIISGICWIWS